MNNKSIFTHNVAAKFSCKKIFVSVNLILVGLISGCATPNPLANQPTDFCEYVDPTSKYYNPDVLTLEQLGICRTQAEKILSIQTMKIQIHQQREQSINNLSTTPPNGKEINTALNQLSTNQPQQVATDNTQNRQRTARSQPTNTNQAVANNNVTNGSARPSSQIIVQKTHPNLGEQSIQQHYLNQRNNRSTQQKLDQEQAQRIAGEVTTLLGDPTTKEKLAAPRLLSPGEETRNPTLADSNTSNTAAVNKEPVSSSNTQPSAPVNNSSSNPKTTQAVTTATNTSNNASSNSPATANASDTKSEKAKTPLTDYTNQPKNIPPTTASAPNNNSNTSSGQPSNSNSTTGIQSVAKPPVAEVVKPNTQSTTTPHAVAPVNPTPAAKPLNEQNKNIGGYQAQPLPTLNEQDPLLLLQQRRAQNK